MAPVRNRLPRVTSAEVRQRLEEFLKQHDRPGRLSGYRLREVRAVELLEAIATPEAIAVLVGLAVGDPPPPGGSPVVRDTLVLAMARPPLLA